MIIKKKLVLISLILFIIIFCIQNAFALTANSSNYSVSMFGTGMATVTPSSANYNSTILSEAKATTRNAQSDSYTVNIGFFNNTAPYQTVSITSYSISPTSAVVGSTISLYISALNFQSVWAKITSPNSQEQTLNLINGQTVNYVPSPSVVGTYEVIFYANSSTGTIASVIDYFELTAQSTTPPSGGGGGGSTTIIIEKCTYNWDCTPWSVCADGKQTRTCKNVGTCNGTENKPIEEMPCSEALFDIVLKLKNIELTENKTLKFNIDLTEQIGVEKIDTHIKYSIMNKEGYEIFSQIETKAVQKSLSYEKEIEEVKLVDGEYTLRVDILYGNLQRAFAEQKIKIYNGKIEEMAFPSEKKFVGKFLIIFADLIIIVVLIVFILIKLIKKKKKEKEGLEYKRKIETDLKELRSKTLLTMLLIFIGIGFLFTAKKSMIGFVIGDSTIKNSSWNFFGFILVVGMLGLLAFLYRNKIKVSIEKTKEKIKPKYPKNSIKGLMKKKAYTEEGEYIGNIKEVALEGNRINTLKIKLDRKNKFRKKGIIVKYKNVKSVGHIVIVDDKIIENIEKDFY